MMRALAIAASLAILAIAVAPIPEVEARPPDLPPEHTGCNYFHYHNGEGQDRRSRQTSPKPVVPTAAAAVAGCTEKGDECSDPPQGRGVVETIDDRDAQVRLPEASRSCCTSPPPSS